MMVDLVGKDELFPLGWVLQEEPGTTVSLGILTIPIAVGLAVIGALLGSATYPLYELLN